MSEINDDCQQTKFNDCSTEPHGWVVCKNETEEFDIIIYLPNYCSYDSIPENEIKLYIFIEETNNILKSLKYTTITTKETYFNKLLSAAQAGLVGKASQPSLAFEAISKLREEMIIVEGTRIKNKYMINLGLWATLGIVIAVIVIGINFCLSNSSVILSCSMSFIGAMVGTWVSFGARKFNINFEELSIIEEDLMKPPVRLIFIGVCSIILLLFLDLEIITINIGDLSSSEVFKNVKLSFFVGIICGLIESQIGISIYKKAKDIVSI